MTTDLDETKLQLLFLPINVYIEDTITVGREEIDICEYDCYSIEK